MTTIANIEKLLGEPFFAKQTEALEVAAKQQGQLRLCLYHATGKGKSRTALAAVMLAGHTEALIVAPPVTRPAWYALAEKLGVQVSVISHAKFRMDDYKLSRTKALIVDEFHLLGGQKGKGWKKLDKAAEHIKAPLVICSATPQYNDAERVYCVAHALDPLSHRGGFIQFLYEHCTTEQNPFGVEPVVTGFRQFKDAEEFLASLPYVHYVEDEVIKQVFIDDEYIPVFASHELPQWGIDRNRRRLFASQMEERHAIRRHTLLVGGGRVLKDEVLMWILDHIRTADTPVMIFSASRNIAEAVGRALAPNSLNLRVELVTGQMTDGMKNAVMQKFAEGGLDVVIGTSTMATGFDGADKVCDTMLIVVDTDDDAQRRQLMGRILPRGKDADASNKRFYRLSY